MPSVRESAVDRIVREVLEQDRLLKAAAGGDLHRVVAAANGETAAARALRDLQEQNELLKHVMVGPTFAETAAGRAMSEMLTAQRLLDEAMGSGGSRDILGAAGAATSAEGFVEQEMREHERLRKSVTTAARERDDARALAASRKEDLSRLPQQLDDLTQRIYAAERAASKYVADTQSATITASLPAPATGARPVMSAADLGPLIRSARKAMKFNQADFAAHAGVGRRFLSELEGGKSSLEFDKVLACAAAAGIDLFARPRHR